MLETRSISRHYGSLKAVDAVSFTVNPGEIVGLLGHNGAGKTTIMKMLSGALEPDEGSILLDGQPVDTDPTRLQRTLGYLPEHLPIYPELSVASYLDYAAGMKGLGGDRRRQAIRDAIDATDLGERLLSPIGTLSRGLKQRVGVAQALLGNPSLLILDEPTNGLDPRQTERMRELVRRVATNATVILSTHVMQEVEAICDRVLIVRDGRLVVDSRLDDLLDARQVQLLTTSPEAETGRVLDSLPGVAAARAQAVTDAGLQRWTLELSADLAGSGGLPAANAFIADALPVLLGAGIRVGALHAVTRDVQTLFLEAGAAPAKEISGDAAPDESVSSELSADQSATDESATKPASTEATASVTPEATRVG